MKSQNFEFLRPTRTVLADLGGFAESYAHEDQPWAALVLAGEFGTLAPDAITKLGAAFDADVELARATTARSEAATAAYGAFLSFKQVVRQRCGKTSKEYRWIHSRAKASAVVQPAPQPQPVPSPGPVVSPSGPTNGASITPMLHAAATTA